MHTYPIKPIPGDPTDPAGLTALLHRYLIWMETHHYAQATAMIRRVTLSKFILWCDDRSVTRAADVSRQDAAWPTCRSRNAEAVRLVRNDREGEAPAEPVKRVDSGCRHGSAGASPSRLVDHVTIKPAPSPMTTRTIPRSIQSMKAMKASSPVRHAGNTLATEVVALRWSDRFTRNGPARSCGQANCGGVARRLRWLPARAVKRGGRHAETKTPKLLRFLATSLGSCLTIE